MAITSPWVGLRSALSVMLGSATINTGNGYRTDVAKFYPEPVPLEKARTPSIMLWPIEGGTSTPETFGQHIGVVEQNYRAVLLVRDDNPHTALANLLADVRYSVEQSGSAAYLNYNGVVTEDVILSEWSEALTSEDLHNKWGLMECTITVRFRYVRDTQ